MDTTQHAYAAIISITRYESAVYVPDWPTSKPVVVEPEPVPVVVNRTAARFGSLEIGR